MERREGNWRRARRFACLKCRWSEAADEMLSPDRKMALVNESAPRTIGALRGCSLVVKLQPSKLAMRVRFPSPALPVPQFVGVMGSGADRMFDVRCSARRRRMGVPNVLPDFHGRCAGLNIEHRTSNVENRTQTRRARLFTRLHSRSHPQFASPRLSSCAAPAHPVVPCALCRQAPEDSSKDDCSHEP